LDAYWELFKPFFRGKKEIIKTKLDEIGTVRNSLAHFRPLKQDDIELIKQNVKHAFVGIEQCLGEMTETHRVVPTNTRGEWYTNLASLGSSRCTVRLFQNESEKWLRVELDYACASLGVVGPGRWRPFTVSNLISPAILKKFPDLACHCTFVSEYITHAQVTEDNAPDFRKQVSAVFARDTLLTNHKEISDVLKRLLLKIETETELIQKENLARGELIDSARLWSMVRVNPDTKRQYWSTEYDKLKCEFGENDPPEYWGEIGLYTNDFIAASSKYPWMPSPISKDELPF
jgi:hypothetical protein